MRLLLLVGAAHPIKLLANRVKLVPSDSRGLRQLINPFLQLLVLLVDG